MTGIIIPVSKGTFFNTNWVTEKQPLCAYDMLYHPPDYNQHARRSDRQQPKIVWNNIWEQEKHKGIPSTSHMRYGRPKWTIIDKPEKLHVRSQTKNQNPNSRIHNVLEWAVLLESGKPSICD